MLYDIGYHVGKVIYLIDSCIDILDDIEKEQFNSLLASYQDNNGVIAEKSQSDIVNIVITSLNTIRTLTKNLVIRRHQHLIHSVLLYGFPQYIYSKIQQSIKKLRQKRIPSLQYLPHAALASALCLFIAQDAEAEGWVWGQRVLARYAQSPFTAYGYICFDNPGSCPLCFIFDCVVNPCLCVIYEDDACFYCCCQIPKAFLDGSVMVFIIGVIGNYVGAIAENDKKKRQQREAEQRQQEAEREEQRRQQPASGRGTG